MNIYIYVNTDLEKSKYLFMCKEHIKLIYNSKNCLIVYYKGKYICQTFSTQMQIIDIFIQFFFLFL